MQPDDIVFRWHDAGCEGMTLIYGQVVRVNRVTVTVKWESGKTWRIDKSDVFAEKDEGVIAWARKKIARV